jgi:succinoglycan biosynthesis transport protein ExoP
MMELDDYLKVIWRWLWLIVLGVAVATVSTYLAVRDQPPLYEAQARLMVGQVLQEQQPSQADVWMAQNLAKSYSEIASGRLIQEATQEALGLAWLPEYAVEQVPNTQLLEIQVSDTDPQRAAAVANEVANQLILQSPTNPSPEQAQRREFVAGQLDGLEGDIQATKAEIDQLQEALGEMFSAREIADTQNQIAALQQKLNDLQANYGQLLLFMGQGAVNTLSLVEPAVVATEPIDSNQLRTVLLAAAVGLVLAIGTAFLLEYLDDTIKTPQDVDRTMHLTTLAGISRIRGDHYEEKLITVKHPKAPISEAYRVLRTNLQFSSLDQPLRTLVVTSPNPVEGKSTTVANLGVVMAQAGKSVIVVDADLRRPVLHRIFQLNNDRGLTDVLLSAEPLLDGHLQATGVENLRLLNTGPLPPNPSELLGSQRMARLIEQLKAEADVVLFDSPPSLAVTDASVLATQTDGVLIVADAGRTRRNLARESVERFQQVGAKTLGVVLNRLKAGRGGSYYYYNYYYGDGKKRRRRGLRRWLP